MAVLRTTTATSAAATTTNTIVCSSLGTLIYVGASTTAVYRSTNNGVTFSTITVPTGTYLHGCCSPTNNYLFLFGTNVAIKSTDDGLTWSSITAPNANTPYACICDNSGNLYVNTNFIVFVSSNNGTSYTTGSTISGVGNAFTLDTVNNVVYLDAGSTTAQVCKVSTAGVCTSVSSGLGTRYTYSVTYLNGYLYAPTYLSGKYGIYRTPVSSIAWTLFYTPSTNTNGICIANPATNTILAAPQGGNPILELTTSTVTASYVGAGDIFNPAYACYNPVDGCIYVVNDAPAAGGMLVQRLGVCIPKASPVAGTYSATQSVVLTSDTSSVTIYYTTDGTTPTTSSSVYSGAVSISSTETLKAIAVVTNYTASGIFSGLYTINSKTIHVGSGGTWHTVTASYVGAGGIWKLASVVDAGSGGVWK